MDREDIKQGLRENGSCLAHIADRLGVQRCSVTHCLKGNGRSKRIETEIAKDLGKPLHEVFPDRYQAA